MIIGAASTRGAENTSDPRGQTAIPAQPRAVDDLHNNDNVLHTGIRH